METKNIIQVDGMEFPVNGERNLLEVIRKGGNRYSDILLSLGT